MTPLGVSVSASPPRHRAKPDSRQAIYRSMRHSDSSNPGPSSSGRQNFFFATRVTPYFPNAFFSSESTNVSSSCTTSNNSDSSDEEDEVVPFKPEKKCKSLVSRLFSKDTNGKYLIHKKKESKNQDQSPCSSRGRNVSKISDCVQYTFPKINEGIHQTDVQSVVTSVGHEIKKKEKKESRRNNGAESESSSSFEFESRRKTSGNFPVDFEQDGFQADESSNGVTSDDESAS